MAIRDDALFGESENSVFLSNVNCHGDETDLLLCSYDRNQQQSCDDSETSGVICDGMLSKTSFTKG